jgi:hypothetical protein
MGELGVEVIGEVLEQDYGGKATTVSGDVFTVFPSGTVGIVQK